MEKKKEHKRKGLIATIFYHILMVIAFVFLGLTYQDPPPEDGIAINFGYEDDGNGNTSQSAPEQTAPPQVEEPQVEEIDNVATQDVEDAPAVSEEKPKKEPTEKPVEKPKPEPKPTPSNKLADALNKAKNSEDATGQGEGETKGGGDQGDRNGDPNSSNRSGGGTGDGNFNLEGRNPTFTPEPKKGCHVNGRIVVKVRVDRNGKTISVETGVNYGAKKTNLTNSCALRNAKEAALRTTWERNPNANEIQIGYIIYNFTKN